MWESGEKSSNTRISVKFYEFKSKTNINENVLIITVWSGGYVSLG